MTTFSSISDLMVSHHGLLEALFAVFKDNLKTDSERANETLNNLEWELEKHIFGEEKVLFRLCSKKNSESCELARKLEEEHDKMLEILASIRDSSTVESESMFAEFQALMIEHREKEEKELYPKLDRELDEKAKKEVIDRINEIPIKQ